MSGSGGGQHPNPIYPPRYIETFSGSKLNGLARQVMERLIHINSAVRETQAPSLYKDYVTKIDCDGNCCDNCVKCCYLDKWSSSNFYVYLPEIMQKVVTLAVQGIYVPNTIYPISYLSDTNVFQVIDRTTDIIHTIEIPPGNYTTTQLVQIINNILAKCLHLNKNILQCGYDSISGRFFFYITKNNN